MSERSKGPGPHTLLGDGRRLSRRSASRAKFVVVRSGRAEGSVLEVGSRAEGLKVGEDAMMLVVGL